MNQSDILKAIIKAYKYAQHLETIYARYLRSKFDYETNTLDDPTPAHEVQQLKAEILRLKPHIQVMEPPTPSLPPKPFMDAYELLHITAYGSDSLNIGDPNKIENSGKAFRGRVKSDQVETRGGAHQKRKLSSSQTSIIKNERAFNQKARVDKRLRTIAREILRELEDPNRGRNEQKCPGCGRFVTTRFCGHCGRKVEADDEA